MRRCFTLLEILIALAVLTGGTICTVRAFHAGLRAFRAVEDSRLALHIAAAKMENIRNTPFRELADSGPDPDPEMPEFYVTVDVSERQDPMQVDVTVEWSSRGETQDIMLSTLVTDY